MPFEQTELSEEEKKKQLEQQTNPFGGQTIGAGAGAEIQPSTLGGTPSPSRLSPVTPQTPTQSFGTIQDYFKGSREQGERFGEQFTGKLAETQQQQRGAIGQAATGTIQDIKGGTIGFDEGLISGAVTDPTQVTGDEGQFEDFLRQWNAQYEGPQTFEGSTQYGQAAKVTQEAQAKAAQLETTGGRQQIIQDEFGVYGRGKKGLDEALLQQSSFFPETQEQAKGFRSLQDYLASQSEDVSTEAQQAKEITESTKQQTREAFTGNLTKFQEDLNARTAAARQKAEGVIEKYKGNLANADPGVVRADLDRAGVDAEVADQIVKDLFTLRSKYGVTPDVSSAYFRNPASEITPGNVASREDYERADAYQKLTGRDYSGVLNPTDIEQAGTGTSPKGGFKGSSLRDYLKSGVGIQDKSLLGTSPKLDWNAVNSGKFTARDAVNQVGDIIAAGKRQNIDPKDNTALKSLESNAMEGIQAIIHDGGNIETVPTLKTYADAAVAVRMAEGESKHDAQKSINDWTRSLLRDPAKSGFVPIYDLSQMTFS